MQLAYSFTTMPTVEGTVKKAYLRIGGTLVGAFSAWALYRATVDNVYGTVAWLTVTTAIALYLSVPKDDSARFGPSKDYSYFGFYWILTQSVIVFEGLVSSADGDQLVVNRLIANLVAITMAVVLAIIPFDVMGSDPKWTQFVLDEVRSGCQDLIQLLLNMNDTSLVELRKLSKAFTTSVSLLHLDALFLLEDAKRFNRFPIYKVDDKLEEELGTITVTSFYVSFLMDQAAEIAQESFAEGTDARATLKKLQQKSMGGKTLAASSTGEKNAQTAGEAASLSGMTGPEILLQGLEIILNRLSVHQAALDLVNSKFGEVTSADATPSKEEDDVGDPVPPSSKEEDAEDSVPPSSREEDAEDSVPPSSRGKNYLCASF